MQDVGPLKGIKVLDFTRVLAGPYCTMILADLGAEVIKIEKLETGDDSRSFIPFIKNQSAYFININRGKKSIAINLKHPKGRKLAIELAKRADIIVENFRPGVMDRLGLGYEQIKKVNPRIIYASISLAGQTGPYRDRPGYDLIGQAMGGLMSITGWPYSPPTRVGTAIADILAGLNCCIAILAALRAREITNEGQRIDISLIDSVVSANEAYNMMYLVEGKIPERIGNRYEFVYPYDSFKTKDGWIVMGVANDEVWRRLCEAMGKPNLVNDDRFDTNEKRVRNHEELKRIIEEWTSKMVSQKVLDILMKYRVPCGPIYTIKDVCSDPHIANARGMVVEIDQPEVGRMKIIGSPIKIQPCSCRVRSPAPMLGEHTREILKNWLKLSDTEINELITEGVIR